MSKLWLLLLLVAAFQAVHSYPAYETDYLEDAEESTWSILKDTFGKLKDLYTEKGKEALEKITEKLKEKLCNQQDFDEDFDFEEDEEPTVQLTVLQKLRELLKKLQEAKDAEKAKIQRQINALRTKICDKLNQQDFEEDKAESTAAIIKDTWTKLKDLWKKKAEQTKGKAQDKLQQLIAKLKDTLCKQKDFEELDYEEDDASDSVKNKLMKKIKELQEKIKKVAEEKKLELLQRIEELRAKLCDKLSDVDTDDGDDEERIKWGKIGKNILKGAKKAWKKMKPALKNAVKKGAKLLKKNAIKVTPFECEEKSCKTCLKLTFIGVSACLRATITRTNKNTYFTIAGEINGNTQFEERIRLGDLPRCVNAGSVIGKLCLKGMEGKGKSSQGKAQVNFCLGFLAEQHNVGVKVCASYENKKFKIKLNPELFAGGLDDSGDIVVANPKDDGTGVTLDADEFEID
ncbi:hypothetical protein O3M35_002835 [Rhynocoris fuscipes]|uniref:Uncharacterized protein n=1 Tax=Rhynocoris fuscipes TaxID=488301 RepID=A0AAW1CN11_9HEMI